VEEVAEVRPPPTSLPVERQLTALSQLAYLDKFPLVGTRLATAANAVPVAGSGLAVGGVVGTVTEDALLKAGANREAAAAGLASAIFANARVGALVGAPFEGIGAVPGAIIGEIAGAIGFALFRF